MAEPPVHKMKFFPPSFLFCCLTLLDLKWNIPVHTWWDNELQRMESGRNPLRSHPRVPPTASQAASPAAFKRHPHGVWFLSSPSRSHGSLISLLALLDLSLKISRMVLKVASGDQNRTAAATRHLSCPLHLLSTAFLAI